MSDLQAMFEAQRTYLNSGKAEKDGSRAIAAGRLAGFAYGLGQVNVAQAIWSKEIPNVAGMPSFAEFCAGYETHQDAFAEFGKITNFSAGGTAFSNAAGSYAYALDNAARGNVALAGGEPQWAGHWGKAALNAAGFAAQAEQLNQAVASSVILKTNITPAFPI